MTEPLILLIEDSADDAALIERALRRHSSAPRVVVTGNGRDALDFLRRCDDDEEAAGLPRLILLDYNLPLLSGLETLGEIRTQPSTRRLPVVVVSGSRSPRDVRAATLLGANSFVRKPSQGAELEQLITRVADYWLDLNLPPP